MEDFCEIPRRRVPTGERPLEGLTILVVEDSVFACEALRLMSLRSGARIRRADCLRSARRHLKVYRPSVVIIDLGLPDGSGLELIDELNRATPRVDVILGLSGETWAKAATETSGADGFLAKPLGNLAQFQHAILEHLPPELLPSGLRVVRDDVIGPNLVAYRDDISHVANLLNDYQDGPVLDYVAQFLTGVAKSAEDGQLADVANELAQIRKQGDAAKEKVAQLMGLVRERLDSRMAI